MTAASIIRRKGEMKIGGETEIAARVAASSCGQASINRHGKRQPARASGMRQHRLKKKKSTVRLGGRISGVKARQSGRASGGIGIGGPAARAARRSVSVTATSATKKKKKKQALLLKIARVRRLSYLHCLGIICRHHAYSAPCAWLQRTTGKAPLQAGILKTARDILAAKRVLNNRRIIASCKSRAARGWHHINA